MKIVFVSNYINHHQIPFCRAMAAAPDTEFTFVQLMPMEEERVRMGWDKALGELPFLKCMYDDQQAIRRQILDCDAALFGWSDCEDLIRERLDAGKIVIRVSERIYREGQWKRFSPRGLLAKYHEHIRYRNKEAYLLCAGAYVASDFSLIHAYPDKMFKWGYFPELRRYGDDRILQIREGRLADERLRLMFAGRFIPLKHPEYALKEALFMKNAGLPVRLDMVGSGQMQDELQELVRNNGLEDTVRFTGFMEPDKVRDLMEESDLFFFTSNHLEGWGAVLSEAMNSMCACVAGTMAGAAPFLIENGSNGILYDRESFASFHAAVQKLVSDGKGRILPAEQVKERCFKMGQAAYGTMADLWNAQKAADELAAFIRCRLAGNEYMPPSKGPMSRALVIKPFLKIDE
ncbi:MAG: glycosyltransferase family 4 protein [Lachnospiraceae bacterium]|nr:glycosyltransferase family 4 protein [Lachnospiraceae bacterium]